MSNAASLEFWRGVGVRAGLNVCPGFGAAGEPARRLRWRDPMRRVAERAIEVVATAKTVRHDRSLLLRLEMAQAGRNLAAVTGR
jgi:hypothetical protein